MPLTIILDNARYQRCALVHPMAETAGIEWLEWPTHAPNLNLIDRLWKYVENQCVYSMDYPHRESFQQAVIACIEPAPITHREELKSRLTRRVQTFQAVLVIGEQRTVSNGSKTEDLSKAA
jgi:transposase